MDNINIENLNSLSKDIMKNQATINIGTIGHVAHGKSTIVRALTGIHTVKFKTEKERNITIKLGYANCKIYKCNNENCDEQNYCSKGSGTKDEEVLCQCCFKIMELVRHISFVDCPGHDILMATMLSGVSVMDAALLLIAANEKCPQPQTNEHLAAIEIMKLKNVIILQNKVDLIEKKKCEEQYIDIKNFTKGTIAENAPIIPISAQKGCNIQAICKYIVEKIPIPERDLKKNAKMMIIRSFDINKPGLNIKDLRGGVIGGSIMQGILYVGQKIEIRPGLIKKNSETGTFTVKPLITIIKSLYTESNNLDYAIPGGLIGIGTNLEPAMTRADKLVGHILGEIGTLPDIYIEIEISFFLLKNLLGVKSENKTDTTVKNIMKNEILMINIGSTSVGGTVLAVKSDLAKLSLSSPVCANIEEKLSISRKIGRHWRLIGWGKIRKGSIALNLI